MEKKSLSAINQSYLSDLAYDRISEAIVTGGFRPGEKLTIRNLADLLQISSTPVRDAIKRLLLEGALEQRSARDVRVPVITRARYQEIADIRGELEGMAAARAAERRNADDLKRLHANISENEAAIDAQDWQRATTLNKEFHFALAEISDMPVLVKILSGLWLQIGPPISAFYKHGERAMIDLHYDIYAAIRDQKPDVARAHMQRDISASVENILQNLDAAAEDTEGPLD